MPNTLDPKLYENLSVEERLRLVDEIMQSIVADAQPAGPLGPTWKEAEERLAHSRANPASLMTWEEVCNKLGWTP